MTRSGDSSPPAWASARNDNGWRFLAPLGMTTTRLPPRSRIHMTTLTVRRAGLAALTALAMSLAAGCSTDEVLTVNDPDVVRPEAINDPAALPVYLTSAYAEVLAGY